MRSRWGPTRAPSSTPEPRRRDVGRDGHPGGHGPAVLRAGAVVAHGPQRPIQRRYAGTSTAGQHRHAAEVLDIEQLGGCYLAALLPALRPSVCLHPGGGWTSGVGGNLSRTCYEQFTLTAVANGQVRLDSLLLTTYVNQW